MSLQVLVVMIILVRMSLEALGDVGLDDAHDARLVPIDVEDLLKLLCGVRRRTPDACGVCAQVECQFATASYHELSILELLNP